MQGSGLREFGPLSLKKQLRRKLECRVGCLCRVVYQEKTGFAVDWAAEAQAMQEWSIGRSGYRHREPGRLSLKFEHRAMLPEPGMNREPLKQPAETRPASRTREAGLTAVY